MVQQEFVEAELEGDYEETIDVLEGPELKNDYAYFLVDLVFGLNLVKLSALTDEAIIDTDAEVHEFLLNGHYLSTIGTITLTHHHLPNVLYVVIDLPIVQSGIIGSYS